MDSYLRGLIIRRIFASEIWGAFFLGGGGRGAYYRNFTGIFLYYVRSHPIILQLTSGMLCVTRDIYIFLLLSQLNRNGMHYTLGNNTSYLGLMLDFCCINTNATFQCVGI